MGTKWIINVAYFGCFDNFLDKINEFLRENNLYVDSYVEFSRCMKDWQDRELTR